MTQTISESEFDWRTKRPWLPLSRAAVMALSPTKVLLAAIGVMLMDAVIAITQLAFEVKPTRPFELMLIAPDWMQRQSHFWGPMCRSLQASMLMPLEHLVQCLLQLSVPSKSWAELAAVVTTLLATLLIWGTIGGAICRLAALRLAKNQRRSGKYALKFVFRQGLSYLIAPALPLSAMFLLIGFITGLGWLAGWMSPYGQQVVGVFWGPLLLVTLAINVLMLIVGLGWPLMVSAISTEDSDGFDGLSRSYGFLWDHSWYALLLGIAAAAMGCIAVCGVQSLFSFAQLMGEIQLQGAERSSSELPILMSFWNYIWSALGRGYGVSYFWCASTLIYMLLRQCDDGTPLREVATYRD